MAKENKKRKPKSEILTTSIVVVLFIILAIYAITIIFTLGWGLLTSLKSNLDFQIYGNKLGLPNLEYSKSEVLLSNYSLVMRNFIFSNNVSFYSNGKLIAHKSEVNFLGTILNTILYVGVGALILALVPAVVAYICTKYKFKYLKIFYVLNMISLTVPVVGTYAPTLVLVRNMGIYDTFIGNFIQKFTFAGMYFLVFCAFYQSLSDSYIEAAEIDGASQTLVLVKIILPLSIKMIATVFLLQAVALWNDYQTCLMYLPTKPTLAYGVYYMAYQGTNGTLAKVPARITATLILALPLLIIFIIFKDRLMGNISIGGVKE